MLWTVQGQTADAFQPCLGISLPSEVCVCLWLPCSEVVVALGQFSQSTWCLLCCLTHLQSLRVAQGVKEGAQVEPSMKKESSSFHIDDL